MDSAFDTLENDQLKVSLLLPGSGYQRSRYDWSGMVEQVTCNGHTFLSKERNASGGIGLGGIGLSNVFEWKDTSLYDSTEFADCFPILGVGCLKKTDTIPFLFTHDYPVLPFKHKVERSNQCITIHTFPYLCHGIAADMKKSYSLNGNTLIMTYEIKNTGPSEIHATEFCHNFFCFDQQSIDSHYRIEFPYVIEPKLRRGQLIVEPSAYRLGAFDTDTESTAFWIHGWTGLQSHWMRITHDLLGLSVLIEDDIPICNFYSWNNPYAFCPEVFAPIDLEPGQSLTYTRRYTFENS